MFKVYIHFQKFRENAQLKIADILGFRNTSRSLTAQIKVAWYSEQKKAFSKHALDTLQLLVLSPLLMSHDSIRLLNFQTLYLTKMKNYCYLMHSYPLEFFQFSHVKKYVR